MNDQFDRLNALLRPLPLSSSLFPPNSRYYGLPTAFLETANRQKVIYLTRRFVPQPERFALLHLHSIQEGERLDNLAALYFGDPELFWRLCDANRALRPEKLTETPGLQLRITLPEGVPGNGNA